MTAPEPQAAARVYALVLAGGRSKRMGTDKAMIALRGETLLARAVRFWKGIPGIEGVIIAGGREAHFEALPAGCTAVPDLYPGCGPMAGLHAAFVQTDADVLYVSAVDMPFLRPEAVLPLPEHDAAVYDKDGRPEPLFGVYRRSVLPVLEELLKAGEHRMQALLDAVKTDHLPLPEDLADVTANLNRREDLMRAMAGMPPLVQCVGWSGSGKTTFLEKLIPRLTAAGLRVAVMKHDGHGFEMDRPGKDTYRLSAAGAVCTAILGPNGFAVLGREPIDFDELRAKLSPADLILCEGMKYAGWPKLEVHRRATGKPFITHDISLLAAVTDEPVDTDAPQYGLDDIDACANLILSTFFPGRKP